MTVGEEVSDSQDLQTQARLSLVNPALRDMPEVADLLLSETLEH